MYNFGNMSNLTKFLLKPLFDVLAKPGLQGPHEGYETELMLAGKKPVMITAWPLKDTKLDQFTKLQPFIDSRAIVVIGSQSHEFQRHIICTPSILNEATKQADIVRKFRSRTEVSNDEVDFYHDFKEKSWGTKSTDDYFTRLNKPNLLSQETDLLLSGKIGATLPVSLGINLRNLPIDIKKRIGSGELVTVLVDSSFETNVVLSPRSSISSGQELYARYYKNSEGYECFTPAENTRRIGLLLGYTDNDVDFFLGKEKLNQFIREIMFATSDLRKYARVQSLLMEKPAPL
jgi:hypothetical protein